MPHRASAGTLPRPQGGSNDLGRQPLYYTSKFSPHTVPQALLHPITWAIRMSFSDGSLSRLSSIQQHESLLGRSMATTDEEGKWDLAQVYHIGNHTLAQTRSRGSYHQKQTLETEGVAEKVLPCSLGAGECAGAVAEKRGN